MKFKKPLWRKKHKDIRECDTHARYDKNTKKGTKRTMSPRRNGRCFKPLYQFLLASVGKDFSDVYSEAVRRLDVNDRERIYDIVSLDKSARDIPHYRFVEENSMYSMLFIDSNNKLQIAHPETTIEDVYPKCTCCTHTFNGKPLIHKEPTWYTTIVNRYV